MGDYRDTPNKDTNAIDEENNHIIYGACCMQGWRKSNEDAHIQELDIGDGNSLFAVFDGHGGDEVAKYCERNLKEKLINNE